MAMPIFAYGKLKPLRQSKGLNQATIAAELGVSRPTYVLMEQGTKEPTLSQLYTLARLLGVDVDELCADLPSTGVLAASLAKFKELIMSCLACSADQAAITKTKLALLTYLIDFAWHHQTSSPMTGEVYRYSLRGPVADDYLRALDELYEAQAIAIEPRGATLTLKLIEKRQTKLLKPEERALIEQVCRKWRAESTEAIADFVRRRVEVRAPKPGEPIPYESILGEPKSLLF